MTKEQKERAMRRKAEGEIQLATLRAIRDDASADSGVRLDAVKMIEEIKKIYGLEKYV